MNNVVLVGNLTKDPELSYTANTQTAVCRFTVAINRPKRNGEDMGADFIRVTVWGKQGENCNTYLFKGSKVAVNGRIQTGNYVNKEGVTVFTTDVIANNVEFLGSSNSNNSNNSNSFNANNFNANNSMSEDVGMEEPEQPMESSLDDMPDSFQAAEDDLPF